MKVAIALKLYQTYDKDMLHAHWRAFCGNPYSYLSNLIAGNEKNVQAEPGKNWKSIFEFKVLQRISFWIEDFTTF